jgi:hypothetical protein
MRLLSAGEEKPKSSERYGGGGARPRDSWGAETLTNEKQPRGGEPRRTERGKHGQRHPTANTGTNGEDFIENWEFVFTDLQQRGYTKDQGGECRLGELVEHSVKHFGISVVA